MIPFGRRGDRKRYGAMDQRIKTGAVSGALNLLQEDDKWVKPCENRIAQPSRRQYAAAVTHMDYAIGQRSDPNEKKNFASDNPGRVWELMRLLQRQASLDDRK